MSSTIFDLGPGVICQLIDTPHEHRYGVSISIIGTFRHGGLTHSQIRSRLENTFRYLDLDMHRALDQKLGAEDKEDDSRKPKTNKEQTKQ